jgi:hypothetical protein
MTKFFFEQKALVSIGIGDCMVVMYTPSTRHVCTLLKPRQYLRGKQYSPMSVSDKLAADSMIQRSYCKVEEEVVVIRMTDGAWSLLPTRRSNVQYDADAKCMIH